MTALDHLILRVADVVRYGNDPFARGMAGALYFHDPDRHNIEIRIYPPTAG